MVIEGEKSENLLGDIFRIYNILLIKFFIQYTRATLGYVSSLIIFKVS